MIARLACLFRRFGRDRRGTTALEVGMLAAPFFGLLCCFLEICYVHYISEGLQFAVTTASRTLLTGNVNNLALNTVQQFRDALLCPATGSKMPSGVDCSKLIIDIRTVGTFGGADMTNGFYKTSTLYCPGKPSTITVVRVVYPLPAIFPLSLQNRFVGLVNDVPNVPGWMHLLMGEAVFQTEPYTVSNLPSC